MANGQTVQIQPGESPEDAMKRAGVSRRATPPSASGGPAKTNPGESKPGESKPGEEAKAADRTAAVASGPVSRTSAPPEPPNKREFDVRPDDEGMIQYSFRNQSWPDLMRWLAEVSEMSLDWQELPGDYLNLATQNKQTITQARDLFNRHLLARGYTILEFDGVLQVIKTDSINPSLVPKVTTEELLELAPNQFVRVTFVLTSIQVDDILEEFKSLMSKNGKLVALTATNRLEAMDAAVNLQDIQRILEAEQSDAALQNLAREFKLEYIRADRAKARIQEFLGEEPRSQPSGNVNPMMMRQMQQMQQQVMQQMQQMRGQNAVGVAGSTEPKLYMIANSRQNSLIIHAGPEKMALITAFISRIDVPSETATSLEMMKTRMKVYRLTSIDPQKLVDTLIQMDALEPQTTIEVDVKNKALITYASIADQYTIQQVIERLDGSAREFEVIQLRRLNAEQVAGTIKFLMGVEEQEDSSNSRSRYSFRYYDPYGGGNNEEQPNSRDEFRVGANARDNQLLIWSNDSEREEIQKLLVKLGEIPDKNGERSPYRVIDASRSPETFEYLKRLQKQWESMSPNELILPDEAIFKAKNSLMQDDSTAAAELSVDTPIDGPEANAPAVKSSRSDAAKPPRKEGPLPNAKTSRDAMHVTDFDHAASLAAQSANDPNAIPIGRLSRTGFDDGNTEDGNTKDAGTKDAVTEDAVTEDAVTEDAGTEDAGTAPSAGDAGIGSTTTQAPIRNPEWQSNAASESKIRQLIEEDRDAREQARFVEKPPIKISVDARGNLVLYSDDPAALDMLEELMNDVAPPKKDYVVFKVKHATASWISLNLKDYFKDRQKKSDSGFYGFRFGMPQEKEDPQLGDESELRFISDNDTRSIIVTGADDLTLRTIKELIELWDVPDESDDSDVRYTRLVKIQYSRAESIVSAIKDAYRDLLSSNDKAFQAEGDQAGDDGKEAKRASSSSVTNGGMNFNFSGRLSLGVDAITNSVIVSAQGNDLLDLICEMVDDLDQLAAPSGSTTVMQLGGGTSSEAMIQAVKAMMQSQSPQQGQPNQQQANQQANQQGNQQAQQQQASQQQAQQQQQSNRSRRGGRRSNNP
jgi:type II secretory pathway component GspD/PulD (secretin)